MRSVARREYEIACNVQRGLASGAYERGRFSTLRENGVHHFQSLVLAALTRIGSDRGSGATLVAR